MKARPGPLVPHDGTRERGWRASRRWYVLWLVGRSLLVLSPLIVILGGFFSFSMAGPMIEAGDGLGKVPAR